MEKGSVAFAFSELLIISPLSLFTPAALSQSIPYGFLHPQFLT